MLYGRPFVYVNHLFFDPEAQTLWPDTMATGQFQQDIHLWGVNQDPKDSKESLLSAPGTQVLISLERWVPKGSMPAHMEGPPPCNTFYPHSSQGTRTWLLDSLLMSQAWRKQKRTLDTPVSPWEISNTYSELQMSAVPMNAPKIKFLGIRFLRISLKSQHSLAEVVLQNRQEIDFLIPEQGGTWAILNETCCFWVNTSN